MLWREESSSHFATARSVSAMGSEGMNPRRVHFAPFSRILPWMTWTCVTRPDRVMLRKPHVEHRARTRVE